MKKRKTHIIVHLIVFGSLALLLARCVEPFNPVLDNNESKDLLVVEGLLSNEPGSFCVVLSSSLEINNDRNTNITFRPVTGADVQIIDDQGNSYLLMENEPGRYESEDKSIAGIPGYSYTLLISTAEGKHYESSSVLMEEVPEIEELYFEEFTNTRFDLEDPYEETRMNIKISTSAPGDETTYFKWEFEETWEFEMPVYVPVYHGTGPTSLPPSMETIEIDTEKKYCWVTEPSRSILTKSTIDSPSNEVKGFVIQSIGPPDDRLNIKYSILVKQYVIDRKLYEFFRDVLDANVETGGIYGKTPSKIVGNIQCCDGAEPVLGYFMASSIKTKRIFISPSDHQVTRGSDFRDCGWTTDIPRSTPVYFYGTYNSGETKVWSTNKYCTDCRVRGTNVKPDFWE